MKSDHEYEWVVELVKEHINKWTDVNGWMNELK